MSDEKKQPEKKVRSGRITVTLWKNERLMPGQKDSTGYVENWVESQRACVQHSIKRNGEWRNQQIWMNVDELRDLADALGQLNEEGEKSPSPSDKAPLQSSVRVHRIVEYIKANSMDAGLDVFDLEELGMDEVLGKFGIHTSLTSWERTLILNDLRSLVEQQEFTEMAYCAINTDSILPLII